MNARRILLCTLVGLSTLLMKPVPAAETADQFRPLFNGKDLTGWDGDPRYWSVRDGAITGRSTAAQPLKTNTFLIWKGGEISDFELHLKFRFPETGKPAANSGVQYRSRRMDVNEWIIAGYQADMDAGGRFVGMLYEER